MRFSASALANAAAWSVVAVLIAAALIIANRFGFLGLLLLGALTWLVCTRAALDEDIPTYGVEVFKAALNRPRSPEQKAATDAARHATLSPLRFYASCGAALTLLGAAGFAWQLWHG